MSNINLTAQLSSNNEGFNRSFKESTRQVEELRRKLEQNEKQLAVQSRKLSEVKNGAGSFNSMLGTLKGGLGALGLAFGGLQVATELFNGALRGSQSVGDNWASSVQGWRSGIEGFFHSLSSGDFSNFLSNMDEAIRRGREFALQLDKLGDYLAYYGVKESKIQTQISKNRSIISDKNSSKEEVAKAKNEIKALEQELQTATIETSAEARETALKKFKASVTGAVKDLSEKDLYNFLQLPRDTKENNVFNEYRRRYESLLRLSNQTKQVTERNPYTQATETKFIKTDKAKQASQELVQLQKKNFELERMRRIYESISDDERKEFSELIKQADSLEKKYYDTKIQTNKTENRADKLLNLNSRGKGKVKTKVEIDFEVGSLKDYEKQLQELTQQLQTKTFSNKQIDDILKRKNELENLIQSKKEELGLIEIKPTLKEGSLSYIINEINEVQKQINELPIDNKDLDVLLEKLKILQSEKHEIELKLKVTQSEDPYTQLQSRIGKTKNEIRTEFTLNGDSERYRELIQQLQEDTQKVYQIDLRVNEDSLTSIDRAKSALELYKQEMYDTQNAISGIGAVFSNLGSALGEQEGQFLSYVGHFAQGTATILGEVTKLVAANQAKAVSSGVASASALPFPANIASIASVVAQITSIFANLAKFENGGIVPKIAGLPSFGDSHMVRVNPGEMILNTSQQSNLFRLLNSGTQTVNNNIGGNVTFRIEGSNLVGTLNNHQQYIQRVL